MRRNFKLINLFIAAAFLLILTIGGAAAFESGDGTEGNPYQIKTAAQLNDVRNNLSAHYILIADIDFVGTDYENNWVPIGNKSKPFIGSLNGYKTNDENYKIQNLKYYHEGASPNWNISLFGVTDNAVIENINLTNVDIWINTGSTQENTGGIVGSLNNSIIKNCHVEGKIIGKRFVGGIVGKSSYSSLIENCSFKGTITASDIYSGGIVGYGEGNIINCRVTNTKIESKNSYVGGIAGRFYGNITGCKVIENVEIIGGNGGVTVSVGGLVGHILGGNKFTIKDSISEADVTGNGGVDYGAVDVGGLIGATNDELTIENCHSSGSVIAHNKTSGTSTAAMAYANKTGGLIGGIYDAGVTVKNCSATGNTVTGMACVGGLVGFVNRGADIEDCYTTINVKANSTSGGIVGGMIVGNITNCFSTGDITGTSSYIGGLVGQTVNVDIINCFAAGDVTGKSGTAGIVGYAGGNSTTPGNSNITNCYATGSITGTTYTGGIVGNVASYGKKDLTNCYALNKNITGSSTSFPNRLVGYISSFHMGNLTTTNCFAWDNMEGNYNSTQTNEKLYGASLTSVEVWNTFPAEKWTGWSTTVWTANDYFKFKLPVPVWTDKNVQADATHLMPPIMLTYDGNGFTSEADTVPVDSTIYKKPVETGYPEKATVKEPGDMKKEGFEFEKWTTKPDGSGDSYVPGDEIEMKEALTLYAQWKQKSDGNKDGNSGGGTGGAVVVNPAKSENNTTGFENETIIENPGKAPEIIKPILILLFILLAIAIYLFVKRRRDDEEDETGI